MKTHFLLSTYTTLLGVTLNQHLRLDSVRSLERGHGIYFGLTRRKDEVWYVARNLDSRRNILDRAAPTNMIKTRSVDEHAQCPGRMITSFTEKADLHQIRINQDLLYVLTGTPPELRIIDARDGSNQGGIFLSSIVPGKYQHSAPIGRGEDRFHFNSIHFSEKSIYVLAHNWDFGSFVIELDIQCLYQNAAHPHLQSFHYPTGWRSHDVFVENKTLYVLTAEGGAKLLCTDGRAASIESYSLNAGSHVAIWVNRVLKTMLSEAVAYRVLGERRGALFPRGLAADEECFYVAFGEMSRRRARRLYGRTGMAVIDRKSLALMSLVDIGEFGNSADLLLTSHVDLTDENAVGDS